VTPEILLNLKLFSPELIVIAAIVVLFLVDAFLPSLREGGIPLVITLVACLLGGVMTWQISQGSATQFFSQTVASDRFSAFFRYFFFFACGVGAYLAYGSKELKEKSRLEFLILLLCVTFGLCLMATTTHLLVLYLGIETVSIVSFVMAGFNRDDLKSNEASFKYLVFGALASGVMIYGFSLIYGLAGSLQYQAVAKFLQENSSQTSYVVMLALVMTYVGLAYKISSFPLHFWTPDVYEGSPTPVATFFSVGPKAAGFAALLRVFIDVFCIKTGDGQWKALEGSSLVEWMAFTSAATMTIGNLSALGQRSVKRMLAYSSIAHVGYMLMGVISLNSFGMLSILFYLVAYCAMNIGAFWVVCVVSDLKGSEDLEAFRGVGWSMPILGTCMSIFLFSLTGIPLFAGFIGKFLLFANVIKTEGYLWLAVLGVLNSVVSLYYYAKVLKAMWLDVPETLQTVTVPLYHRIGIVALAVPTMVLGLYFTPVIRFAEKTLAVFL